MSKIFKNEYLAGKILEHLYNNADKTFGVDYLFDKFKTEKYNDSSIDKEYVKREIKFLVSDGLLYEENVGLDTRYNADVPIYAYRINNKGISFVTGLLKDSKALRNSKWAMFLSICIPTTLFLAGYKLNHQDMQGGKCPCVSVNHTTQAVKEFRGIDTAKSDTQKRTPKL